MSDGNVGPWLVAQGLTHSQWKITETGSIGNGVLDASSALASPLDSVAEQNSAMDARYGKGAGANKGTANGEATIDLSPLYQSKGWAFPVGFQDEMDIKMIIGAPDAVKKASPAPKTTTPTPAPNPTPAPSPTTPPTPAKGSEQILTLGADSRFTVQVPSFQAANGEVGHGTAISWLTNTGGFWFFPELSPDTVELVVTIIDLGEAGFGIKLLSATNSGFTVIVTDTITKKQWSYTNVVGNLLGKVDLNALSSK